MPPGRWLQSDLISRFRSLNGSKGPVCVHVCVWESLNHRRWIVCISQHRELNWCPRRERWASLDLHVCVRQGENSENPAVVMVVSSGHSPHSALSHSAFFSVNLLLFHVTIKGWKDLRFRGRACKCTNKFPGWGKQRGRERCVSGEVAGAFRCDLWGERGAFHLNSARFSREDIDQNEMWSVAREDERESERLGRVGEIVRGWSWMRKKEEKEEGRV